MVIIRLCGFHEIYSKYSVPIFTFTFTFIYLFITPSGEW